jgi:serine/threonine protein kinase
MVMPLLSGGTLQRTLDGTPWEPAAGLRLLDQIGAALDHAHRCGIVHGDLRSSNVLLDGDGNAFLSDFAGPDLGLRAWSDTGADRPDAAPEQSEGGPGGPASDVYALAMLACEVLAAARPADLAFVPVDLPPGVADVVARATDPLPDRRYERVHDFSRALRRCWGVDVVTTVSRTPSSDTRNPYKGLRAFDETDAGDFFGREQLVDDLVGHVSRHHLTAVVGPSGTGKSSLVKAGLVPALRHRGLGTSRDLVIAEMFPGAHPFEELAAALLEIAVTRPPGLSTDLTADDRGLAARGEADPPR